MRGDCLLNNSVTTIMIRSWSNLNPWHTASSHAHAISRRFVLSLEMHNEFQSGSRPFDYRIVDYAGSVVLTQSGLAIFNLYSQHNVWLRFVCCSLISARRRLRKPLEVRNQGAFGDSYTTEKKERRKEGRGGEIGTRIPAARLFRLLSFYTRFYLTLCRVRTFKFHGSCRYI